MKRATLGTALFTFLAGQGRSGGVAGEGDAARTARRPVTRVDMARLYQRPPSFTDQLPWMEYLPQSRSFLLEDGYSVGAVFELTPVGVEARTPGYIDTLYEELQSALADSVPEDDVSPWIVQVYVQDESNLGRYLARIADHVEPRARATRFTRHYLETYARHLARATRPGGLFEDTAVTGTPWQGKYRRTRLVLYRRVPRPKGLRNHPHARSPEAALNEVAARLAAGR